MNPILLQAIYSLVIVYMGLFIAANKNLRGDKDPDTMPTKPSYDVVSKSSVSKYTDMKSSSAGDILLYNLHDINKYDDKNSWHSFLSELVDGELQYSTPSIPSKHIIASVIETMSPTSFPVKDLDITSRDNPTSEPTEQLDETYEDSARPQCTCKTSEPTPSPLTPTPSVGAPISELNDAPTIIPSSSSTTEPTCSPTSTTSSSSSSPSQQPSSPSHAPTDFTSAPISELTDTPTNSPGVITTSYPTCPPYTPPPVATSIPSTPYPVAEPSIIPPVTIPTTGSGGGGGGSIIDLLNLNIGISVNLNENTVLVDLTLCETCKLLIGI